MQSCTYRSYSRSCEIRTFVRGGGGRPPAPLSLERSNEIFEIFLSRNYIPRVFLRVEQFHFFQSGDPLLSRNKKKKERKKGKERLGIYKFPARISSTVFLPSEIVFRARSRWKQLRFYPKWTTRSRATIQYPRTSDQKVHTTRLKKRFQYLKRGEEG